MTVRREDIVAYGSNVRRRRFRNRLSLAASATPTTGEVGVAYAGLTLTGSKGLKPYTFISDPLPDGITLDASTGVVSGTPTQAGSYSMKFGVRDSYRRVTFLPAFTLVVEP